MALEAIDDYDNFNIIVIYFVRTFNNIKLLMVNFLFYNLDCLIYLSCSLYTKLDLS